MLANMSFYYIDLPGPTFKQQRGPLRTLSRAKLEGSATSAPLIEEGTRISLGRESDKDAP
jgi:hypothetical protein